MLFLAPAATARIAHDRRGHGRSSQTWNGNDTPHKAVFDCIKAFSETDFREDLKKFDAPAPTGMGKTTRSSRLTTRPVFRPC